ncbi:MAG: dTDP-glucose 4,6-dehydratase [Oscillospiraceae bacterium]|nr:dTDP-glucose 4,6-dehydratase [Oscillospiraceae bacterium]
MLRKYPGLHIVNLDALTYAGNLDNLKSIEGDPRHTFIHGDIRDKQRLASLFSGHRFDAVVHFAAESHVDNSIETPDVFMETNVNGTVNLLNAARAAWSTGDDLYREGVKFLQVSTDEVYGSLGPEGLFSETAPLDPHSPYSASKAAADLFVKAYADTYKLPVNITRCSNNYGPYQNPEKLIPLMIHNALNGIPLPVYGDGMQVRDWLYVEDHCAAIDCVLQKGIPGEVYNIGGNTERFNLDIVRLILRYLQKDESLIRHVTDRKGHDRRYAIDAGKIRSGLGWRPETSFETGIVKTIEWYIANRAWTEGCGHG